MAVAPEYCSGSANHGSGSLGLGSPGGDEPAAVGTLSRSRRTLGFRVNARPLARATMYSDVGAGGTEPPGFTRRNELAGS